MRVLLFDGQGSAPTSSSSSATMSTTTASSFPLASLFTSQAHAVLKARLSVLSDETASRLQLRATRGVLADLRSGSLTLPVSDPALLQYPLVSLPSLYLAQVIRLLEDLEAGSRRTAVESANNAATNTTAAVVGYSSGLLPALFVASSFPAPGLTSKDLSPSAQLSLLRNAVALFEVALLLGVETQVAKEEMLKQSGLALDDPLREKEWSMVVFGETRSALEERVEQWNSQSAVSIISIFILLSFQSKASFLLHHRNPPSHACSRF